MNYSYDLYWDEENKRLMTSITTIRGDAEPILLYKELESDYIDELERVKGLINRRRRQILVHSIIYYKYDTNLISDSTWSNWAKELLDLQLNYPELSKECIMFEYFKDFDPSTGYTLPLNDEHSDKVARRLLYYNSNQSKGAFHS